MIVNISHDNRIQQFVDSLIGKKIYQLNDWLTLNKGNYRCGRSNCDYVLITNSGYQLCYWECAEHLFEYLIDTNQIIVLQP